MFVEQKLRPVIGSNGYEVNYSSRLEPIFRVLFFERDSLYFLQRLTGHQFQGFADWISQRRIEQEADSLNEKRLRIHEELRKYGNSTNGHDQLENEVAIAKLQNHTIRRSQIRQRAIILQERRRHPEVARGFALAEEAFETYCASIETQAFQSGLSFTDLTEVRRYYFTNVDMIINHERENRAKIARANAQQRMIIEAHLLLAQQRHNGNQDDKVFSIESAVHEADESPDGAVISSKQTPPEPPSNGNRPGEVPTYKSLSHSPNGHNDSVVDKVMPQKSAREGQSAIQLRQQPAYDSLRESLNTFFEPFFGDGWGFLTYWKGIIFGG